MIPQVEFFSFVFGRTEDTIICFRDLLTCIQINLQVIFDEIDGRLNQTDASISLEITCKVL